MLKRDDEAAESPKKLPAALIVGWVATALGIFGLLTWLAFLAVLFAAPDAGMTLSQVLLAVVGVGAMAAVVANRRLGLASAIIAALHIGLWVYFKVGFDTTMADALFFLIVGLLYLAPPVSAGLALAAGLSAKAAHKASVAAAPVLEVAEGAVDAPVA